MRTRGSWLPGPSWRPPPRASALGVATGLSGRDHLGPSSLADSSIVNVKTYCVLQSTHQITSRHWFNFQNSFLLFALQTRKPRPETSSFAWLHSRGGGPVALGFSPLLVARTTPLKPKANGRKGRSLLPSRGHYGRDPRTPMHPPLHSGLGTGGCSLSLAEDHRGPGRGWYGAAGARRVLGRAPAPRRPGGCGRPVRG